MEESIRNAEKLIEEANAALARMECDESHDDLGYILGIDGDRRNGKSFTGCPRKVQNYLDWGELFGERDFVKRSSCSRKTEELNGRIEAYKRELLEKEEKESMEKLQHEMKELSARRSAEHLRAESIASQRAVSITEDLKSKLIQTQKIVDRGIQTARELSETVELMRKKPEDEKSNSTVKPTKSDISTKRCRRCNAKLTSKRKVKSATRSEENISLVKVWGRDENPPNRKLKLQQLPSLCIPGGLNYQKIPSVNIPPEKTRTPVFRANTSLESYSHEDNIKGRIDTGVQRSKSVKCTCCGTSIGVSDPVVSDGIDELLRACDYDVFDPRIDEFAERFGRNIERPKTERKPERRKVKKVNLEVDKPKIQDLSRQLTRRYRENAAELESDHLRLESILNDLFKKVDESKEILRGCDHLMRKKCELSVTAPVLLSYTGSGEEADDGKNALMRPLHRKSKTSEMRKKRKEMSANCKVMVSCRPAKAEKADTPVMEFEKKKEVLVERLPSPVVEAPEKSESPVKDVEVEYESDFEEESLSGSPEGEQPGVETSAPAEKQQSVDADDFRMELERLQTTDLTAATPVEREFSQRLSTISEVDSEDQKLSDFEAASERKKTDERSETSSSDDDTKELLKKVNRDLIEVAAQQKMADRIEMSHPLREVLDALKDQFSRTEILADRLTETIKMAENGKDSSRQEAQHFVAPIIPQCSLTMLNSVREAQPQPLRETEDRSLSEVVAPEESTSHTGSVSAGKSYSEGEVSEEEVVCSSPSIGEIINDNSSDGSVSPEASVVKFV